MNNKTKIEELLREIEIYKKQIENLEDMVEEAYKRIDELGGIDEITH